MTAIPYCKRPCAECPWRTDVPARKFPISRFRALAESAYDLARMIFACHMSKEGGEVVCAGYILSQGAHNLSLRLSKQKFNVSSDAPLHPNYRAMAIANGLKPNDPMLRNCRDDGQTKRD